MSDNREELLAKARSIAPALADQVEADEANGTLTSETVTMLEDAGMFRLKLPRELGGHEADPATQILVLEELARDAAGRHGLVFVRVLLGPGHACAVPWRFGGAAERGRAAQVVHSVGEVPVGQASVLVQVRACAGSAAPPAAADQRHDAAGRGGRVGAFASPG